MPETTFLFVPLCDSSWPDVVFVQPGYFRKQHLCGFWFLFFVLLFLFCLGFFGFFCLFCFVFVCCFDFLFVFLLLLFCFVLVWFFGGFFFWGGGGGSFQIEVCLTFRSYNQGISGNQICFFLSSSSSFENRGWFDV